MPNGQYILVGHKPVPCPDIAEWGKMFGDDKARRVGWDVEGDMSVSTVFLGLDHRFSGEGGPLLFETMIFRKGEETYCMRYETWDEAEAGHTAACIIAFGSETEAAAKKMEWSEHVVIDRIVDHMMGEDG